MAKETPKTTNIMGKKSVKRPVIYPVKVVISVGVIDINILVILIIIVYYS